MATRQERRYMPGMDGPSAHATRLISPSREAIDQAARILWDGGLVAFPTETVYGLGGDAGSPDAVAAIFAAKRRPSFNPLIVHVRGREAAQPLADFNATADRLAEAFWPGPLTLVLPRRSGARLAPAISAGLQSVAIRAPGHPVAQRLLSAAELPIAAPSANRSGQVSPTTPHHVLAELDGRVPLILAGGRTNVGLESTVIDLRGDRPRLLRPGAVTRAALEAIVGPLMVSAEASAHVPEGEVPHAAPGQLRSHYAPRARLRLEAEAPRDDEAFLAFGPSLVSGERVRNLSETGDLDEAAANLFAALRELDGLGLGTIAVAPVPEVGLGEAINDRLRRAAAPRAPRQS
jgi:L-threonylcarbamoyladenylate synthase